MNAAALQQAASQSLRSSGDHGGRYKAPCFPGSMVEDAGWCGCRPARLSAGSKGTRPRKGMPMSAAMLSAPPFVGLNTSDCATMLSASSADPLSRASSCCVTSRAGSPSSAWLMKRMLASGCCSPDMFSTTPRMFRPTCRKCQLVLTAHPVTGRTLGSHQQVSQQILGNKGRKLLSAQDGLRKGGDAQ